jgi:aminopeptidase N
MLGKCFFILVFCVTGINTLRSQNSTEHVPANTIATRRWWNLLHYDIQLRPDLVHKSISGTNALRFQVLTKDSILQLDLQSPMSISLIRWRDTSLSFSRHEKDYLVYFPRGLSPGSFETITIYFSGQPPAAKNPPFDSGWIWSKDSLGRPWISVACEGSGASMWLPTKDAAYDEPDSGVIFSITVPDSLVAVANGRLVQMHKSLGSLSTFTWKVINPINGYNIIPYIGKYLNWQEKFPGLNGELDCSYWVLDYNLDRSKIHFRQVDSMLRCFEYWLGPYPFYADSYKLIEAPMVGMEHQSAIAYGNGYANSYRGRDLSKSGWGMKWDFIIVHESGHEWFGNSITASDDYESWIHEGFTKYLETIYTGFLFGEEAGNDYSTGIFKRILNDTTVIGSNSSDAYNKSSAMLHYMRQIVGDSIFRSLLRGLNKNFYHQTVSTKQIIDYINSHAGRDFTMLFRQYLMSAQVPVLEYYFRDNLFCYRWTNCVPGFDMPVRISIGNGPFFYINPLQEWKKSAIEKLPNDTLIADRNFYIRLKEMKDGSKY